MKQHASINQIPDICFISDYEMHFLAQATNAESFSSNATASSAQNFQSICRPVAVGAWELKVRAL